MHNIIFWFQISADFFWNLYFDLGENIDSPPNNELKKTKMAK